jgi:hypothetical protein
VSVRARREVGLGPGNTIQHGSYAIRRRAPRLRSDTTHETLTLLHFLQTAIPSNPGYMYM